MRTRWNSRPVKPLSRKKIWLIALVVMLFFSIQTYVYVERNIKPHLMSLATFRIKQIATESINSAITNRIANSVNFQNLVDWKLDTKGDISGFNLNYAQHMKIASDTVEHIEELLHDLSEKGEKVPLGLALGSTIFASLKPDIPIRFVPLGHAKVDLKTRETDVGINNVLVEVYMQVHVEVMIIIPFDTAPEVLTTDIPISYMLVVGDVPMYYFDNKGNATGTPSSVGVPNITLPSAPPTSVPSGSDGAALPPPIDAPAH